MEKIIHSILFSVFSGLCMGFVYYRNPKNEKKWKQIKEKLSWQDKALGNFLVYLYLLGYPGAVIISFFLSQEQGLIVLERCLSISMMSIAAVGEGIAYLSQCFLKKNAFKIMEYATGFTTRCIFLLRMFPVFIVGLYFILVYVSENGIESPF